MVALCERNKARGDDVREYFGGAESSYSYGDLLKRDDNGIAHITPPTNQHAKMIVKAAAGRHILCEKIDKSLVCQHE